MIVLYVLAGFVAFLVLLLVAVAPLKSLVDSRLPMPVSFVIGVGWWMLWLAVVPFLVVYEVWLR